MSATASCFCSSVVMTFPTEGDGLVDTFVCHCTDCRKITASMYASNFIAKDSHIKHDKGEELLTRFAQSKTIASGNEMANYFCSKCGTLMYRVSSGFPGVKIMRIGTIDDFKLHETKLKPRIAQFCKDRVAWEKGAEGVEEIEGSFFGAGKRSGSKKANKL